MISQFEWIDPTLSLIAAIFFLWKMYRVDGWRHQRLPAGFGWFIFGALAYLPALGMYALVALVRADRFSGWMYAADIAALGVFPSMLLLGAAFDREWRPLCMITTIPYSVLVGLAMFGRSTVSD